jgi:hypothetical protein
MGLPGLEKSSTTPFSYAHLSNALDMNSALGYKTPVQAEEENHDSQLNGA